MTTFEPGNIVQIKSGGPIMTVVSVGDSGVHCLWYGETTDDIRTATLPPVVLDLLEVADDDMMDAEEEARELEEKAHGRKKKRKHDDD